MMRWRRVSLFSECEIPCVSFSVNSFSLIMRLCLLYVPSVHAAGLWLTCKERKNKEMWSFSRGLTRRDPPTTRPHVATIGVHVVPLFFFIR